MLEHFGFALSAALVQVATNLDNLAVLLGLMLTLPRRVAVAAFLCAQGLVVSAALAVAYGASDALAGWVGYLGVLPIGLGLWQLRPGRGAEADTPSPAVSRGSVPVTTALFLSLSVDSFLVMTPVLADSAGSFRMAAVTGALAAALGMAFGAASLFKPGGVLSAILPRLDRLTPFVMILAGIYVLSNTGTDVVP